MNIHKLSLLLAATLLVAASSPKAAKADTKTLELRKEFFDRVKEK
jgi:hypothetical protein